MMKCSFFSFGFHYKNEKWAPGVYTSVAPRILKIFPKHFFLFEYYTKLHNPVLTHLK